METVALLIGPPIGIGLLLILPFLNNTGEKHWSRRPVAVLAVISLYLSLGLLTWWGITSPWSPNMTAWRSSPTPKKFLENRTPLELQGSIVMQQKQCRNCHALDGIGGTRGPDLADVGTRLTEPQMIRQVIQGSGNMPAYGKNLSPYEIKAVVSYMVSLRPNGVPAARDSTLPLPPPPKIAPEETKEAAAGNKDGNQG
jgi:ubiquinol-cytochrome c reductase cytochrome b subunit